MLAVLARTARPLPGRQVARLLPDASLRGVQLALERLAREGLVEADPFTHAVLYSVNRSHLLWPAVEALVEAADAAPTRLHELIRAEVGASLGRGRSQDVSVAIFGSAARETATPESDIDLLVVGPVERDDPAVEGLVDRLVENVRVATGNPCNVYYASRRHLAEAVRTDDPVVQSWLTDAEMVTGPDVRPALEGAPWPA